MERQKNTMLRLNYVTNVMRTGRWMIDVAIVMCIAIFIGHVFDIHWMFQPIYGKVTSPQTVILTLVLLLATRFSPTYHYNKWSIVTALAVIAYLITAFTTDLERMVDLWFLATLHDNDSYYGDDFIMGTTTKIILMFCAVGIACKPISRWPLARIALLYIGSYIPFNVLMAYAVGNDLLIDYMGFWTMMITGLLVWGVLFKQAHRKPIRYLIADPQVFGIALLSIGSAIGLCMFGIITMTYMFGIENFPSMWPAGGITIMWIIMAILVAAKIRVSRISYANRLLIQETHRMATQDRLTQTHNRNGFYEIIDKRNPQRSAGVILCDIDYFKSVNDKYGHDRGDEILKVFAKCLKDNVRYGDCVIRWGGEEFLIFCENIDADGLKELAERLREAVEELDVIPPITASFGTDVIRQYDGLHASITRADERLYKAKKLGRNCVIDSSETAIERIRTLMKEYHFKYPQLIKSDQIDMYVNKPVKSLVEEERLFKALQRIELLLRANNTVETSRSVTQSVRAFIDRTSNKGNI